MLSVQSIVKKYGDLITGIQDLIGDDKPSVLFCLFATAFYPQLSNDPKTVITKTGVKIRRAIHWIILVLGKLFLTRPQHFENRNRLKEPFRHPVLSDEGIVLPKEPVIFVANHAFKDDGLATVLAAKRHAYLLFGSLPQFYNTLDGLTAWINGSILVNRKVKGSRKSSIEKAKRAMHFGADVIVFPEGVWNKSPNLLVLPLWHGVYQLACETGAKVVPIIHYTKNCELKGAEEPIHTVIDTPIRINNLSETDALQRIRDTFASWFYLMMSVYGESSRGEALEGCTSAREAWEKKLLARRATADRYDSEIELCADYCPQNIISPDHVWRNVSQIQSITAENAHIIMHARKEIHISEINNFQRRF